MGKALLSTLAIGFTAAAHAADLDVNTLRGSFPDGPLMWRGITLYGTIDVGGVYQSHGAPVSENWGNGQFWLISKASGGHQSMLTENGLSSSTLGIVVKEQLGYGLTAIGQFDGSFDPISGELANGPSSLLRNAGRSLTLQSSNADSYRAGQLFNGSAFAGLGTADYGALTIGRHSSLVRDGIIEYDPHGGSYGFSGGGGLKETGFLDNSVKYSYEDGPLHAVLLYSEGGADTGQSGAYQLKVGGKIGGFSADVVYSYATNVVSLSTPTVPGATVIPATLANSEVWSVQGKYTFNIGWDGFNHGGEGHQVIVYAGHENVSFSNPNLGAYIPNTSQGGFSLGALNINNFTTDNVLQINWAGLKYYWIPDLTLTGAFYRVDQNSFVSQGRSAAQTPLPSIGVKTVPNASGAENVASFVADYVVNKHLDIYVGANYSAVSGGLASGFLNTNERTAAIGARLKF